MNKQQKQVAFLKYQFAHDDKTCLIALMKMLEFHIEGLIQPDLYGYTDTIGIRIKDRHLLASLAAYFAEHGQLTAKQMDALRSKMQEYAERYLYLVDRYWLYEEMENSDETDLVEYSE